MGYSSGLLLTETRAIEDGEIRKSAPLGDTGNRNCLPTCDLEHSEEVDHATTELIHGNCNYNILLDHVVESVKATNLMPIKGGNSATLVPLAGRM